MASQAWRDKNREKVRAYSRAWYHKNDNKVRQKASQKIRSEAVRSRINSYKETLWCFHCAFKFQGRPECCDFHHLDPQVKSFSLGAMHTFGWSRIMDEIAKCIPLCANCHRTETLHKTKPWLR